MVPFSIIFVGEFCVTIYSPVIPTPSNILSKRQPIYTLSRAKRLLNIVECVIFRFTGFQYHGSILKTYHNILQR